METLLLYKKIKAYLKLLWEETRRKLSDTIEISIYPCGYKSDNSLPDPAMFVPYDSTGVWGTGWDSHAWFRFVVNAHHEQGEIPVILKMSSSLTGWDANNPQFLIFVDGEIRQGMDTNHTELFLDGSHSHEIYVYAYTGPKIESCRFIAELFEYHPKVEKLWYDIKVPYDSLAYLESYSNEYQNILRYLDEALLRLNLLEVPSAAFYESVEQASRYMDEEFYGAFCGQTPTAPKVVCIGHTHIDCAWLWTLKQTREKVQRSFSTVLELMNRYPEYRFMSSQALLYQNLKEEAPEVYEQVKKRIAERRWECEGSMWVEADCNLSSGESLVRQILYGKRFFREEFGVETRVLWLPDVFGYSAALPQILKKSGVDWFVTSKISWNDVNIMPYDTFDWQGIDGTRIHSYFLTAQEKILHRGPDRFTTYVAHITPSMVAGTHERYQQKQLNDESLLTFGFGDGGGGPTTDDLEYARRISRGIPGTPQIQIGFAGDFLSRLEQKIEGNPRLPVWQGELYLEHHRGTLTSAYRNKVNNRRSEFLYLNTEWICSLAKQLLGVPFPKTELHRGWEKILTNQFHDILPGSSIKEVYDQCEIDYQIIREIAEKAETEALKAIACGIPRDAGYVIFNPNPFEGNGLIRLEDGKTAYVEKIPAKGYACVRTPRTENHILATEHSLENRFYRLIFDGNMLLSSIYDKINNREILQAGACGNELRIYEDYPYGDDAWEWCEYSLEKYSVIGNVLKSEIISDGARTGIQIVRKHLDSTLIQTVWLCDELERIDFELCADWHQRHQMMKVAFPVDINSDYATYEIQYGSVRRPTHKNTTWDVMKFEVCAQKFADLSEGDYGVALLNDCKYGHDIHDGVMTLSLIRCATYPNPESDQGEMRCAYSICPHKGPLVSSRISAMAYDLNNPMAALPACGSKATFPIRYAMVESDRKNVLCEAVKEAEDGDDLIMRFYECDNTKTEAKLTFGFDIQEAALCNLMEEKIRDIPVEGRSLMLSFHSFEIQTIRLKLKNERGAEKLHF